MPINTERQHPILTKIPDIIWEHKFKGSFNENYLNLANKPFSEISREDLPQNDAQAFIVIMLC